MEREYLIPGHDYGNLEDNDREFLTPGFSYKNEEEAPAVTAQFMTTNTKYW
jgi:hypothetical protein